MSDTETKSETLVEYTPPSQMDPAELTKLFVEDGVITPERAAEVTGKSATPPAAEPAPATPAPKDDEVPALVRIAREKDALRKEKESVSPHLQMLKRFTPQQLQRLAAAAEAEDPVAAMAALNFTHSQYTNKLLGSKQVAPETPVSETSDDPKYTSLQQEVAALRAERENERIQTSRSQFFSKTEALLKDDPKFKHLVGLGEWESVERVVLEHIQETGQPPGETLEETIRLAAEVVEHRLKKQAEKWSKVLTPGSAPAPVPSKAPESPRPAPESPRTLTNANTTAPAAARTVPKTEAEILQAIADGVDLDKFLG